MSNQKRIGTKIGLICQNLRKAKGISQKQLADEIGVSLPTIGKLESGGPLNFKGMITLLEYFGQIEGLETALDKLIDKSGPALQENADLSRYESLMVKVREGGRLNLEEFEHCIAVVPRKEYPVLENVSVPVRRAGMAIRYEQNEDAFYATSVGFLKELKRRKDGRFDLYRMGEKSEFASVILSRG